MSLGNCPPLYQKRSGGISVTAESVKTMPNGGVSNQMLRLLPAPPHSAPRTLAARLLSSCRKLEDPFLGILSNHKEKPKDTNIGVHHKAAQVQSPCEAQS